MVTSDRLERLPLVGGPGAGDEASHRHLPRSAAGYAASVVALVAVVALAVGADAPGNLLASLGQAPALGAAQSGATCESRVRAATKDSKFYAFDVFAFTPFNVKGEYTRDPSDEHVLTAKTTPAEFMYPQWLRNPLRADSRRVASPEYADLLIMTDSFVDISPFVAKFVWHTGHPEKSQGSWGRLIEWWSSVGGDEKGALVVGEARKRLRALKERVDGAKTPVEAKGGEDQGEETRAEKPDGVSDGVSDAEALAALGSQKRKKYAFMLPSEWMFGKEDVAAELRLGKVMTDVFADGEAMTAVTDFDDDGPNVPGVVFTVPFAVHSAVADYVLGAGGAVDYASKRRETFFKGTGDRGLQGTLGKQTEARMALRELVGMKHHDVYVSSDDDSKRDLKRGTSYSDGMLGATFCWIPRGDNPTSRRIFDAVAAGCIPVVVSDDIARYLPFRWAVDWRAMILQVPEAVFTRNAKGVAEAVLALPDAAVAALRKRLDAARYKLLWNDRASHEDVCGVKGETSRCSEAPRLYLDEMLFRAANDLRDPDAPLCQKRPSDGARFADGAAWSAKGACPPWLAMRGVCGEGSSTAGEAVP